MEHHLQSDRPYSAHWSGSSIVLALLFAFPPTPARADCIGDCDGSFSVTVDEIVSMVNIALGVSPVSMCLAADADHSGAVEINEIVAAVNASLLDTCEGERCGNGVVAGAEECDDGGICIGGPNAGSACRSESECLGHGVCEGGPKFGTSCAADAECPSGRCVHCKTFGGDGCAANCTAETDILVRLVSGGLACGLDICPGTSGAVVYGDVLTIPLPLIGTEVITVGKPGPDGVVPAVIKAASVQFPRIAVSTLACACIRSVAYKTCGGTLFEADGSESTPCTDGYQDKITCPADHPCAFVHGPDNSATAVIGCGDAGLPDVNLSLTQDAGGEQRTVGPVIVNISPPNGPRGSSLVTSTTAIGTVIGACSSFPTFCSDADPMSQRGTPTTIRLTTGEACCEITGANGIDDANIGPFCIDGRPLNCGALMGEPLSGTLAGAFPTLNQSSLGDVCVTSRFVFSNLATHQR